MAEKAYRKFLLVFTLLSCWASAGLAQDQTILDAKPFAHRYKDRLTEDELTMLFFCIWCNKKEADIPSESRAEAIRFARTIPVIRLQISEFVKANNNPPYSIKSVNAYTTFDQQQWQLTFKTSESTKPDTAGVSWKKWRLFVRQSYNQVGFLDMTDNPSKSTQGPDTAAKPAIFAYTHNQLNEQDTWTAQGSVGGAFFLRSGVSNPHESPFVDRILLAPNVTFDRVTGSGAKQKTDSLTFRLASLADIVGPTLTEHQELTNYFRLNFTHATDWEFRSQVLGGEFEWEPVISGVPFIDRWDKIPLPLLDQFEFNLRAYLHSEGGSVINPGQKADLAAIEGEYARLGFFVEANGRLAHLRRFSFSTSYEDFEALTSDSLSQHLFTAGAQFNIDDKGAVSLKLQYRDGRLPFVLDRVQDVTAGIGIQF